MSTAQQKRAAAAAAAAARAAAPTATTTATTTDTPVSGATPPLVGSDLPPVTETTVITPDQPNWFARMWRRAKGAWRAFVGWLKRAKNATVHGIKTGYRATSRVLVRGWDRGVVRTWLFVWSLVTAIAYIFTELVLLPFRAIAHFWRGNAKELADQEVGEIRLGRAARRARRREERDRMRLARVQSGVATA